MKYIEHGSATVRFVQNLVDSAINNRVNLSTEDPTFLAKEMRHHAIDEKGMKTVMALD